MESELVRRRIHMIASHFPPTEDISPTLLLPMNCSGSFNSVLRRCDNKVYFARQSSASLGYFMRQTSVEEGSSTSFVAPKTHGATSESPSNAREPCFARPARTELDSSNSMFQPMAQVPGYDFRTPDPPTFARPSRQIRRGDQLHSEKNICYSNGGIEWSPRMDVVESEGKYVITVEVPGVNTSDIRVEVDDHKLSVKGSRSTRSWTVAGCPNASFSSYHKREIQYGPYEVAWPLPTGVNKESVSAEFIGAKWGQPGAKFCEGQMRPVFGFNYPGGAHPAELVLEKVLGGMSKPVYLLNITTLLQLRKDGHPSVYGHGGPYDMDCSHWCLPSVPDTWNVLLYAALLQN